MHFDSVSCSLKLQAMSESSEKEPACIHPVHPRENSLEQICGIYPADDRTTSLPWTRTHRWQLWWKRSLRMSTAEGLPERGQQAGRSALFSNESEKD
jgi:hypothetical protein